MCQSRHLLFVTLGIAVAGCRELFAPILPDTRSAADHAHEVEPRCKTSPETSATALLAPASIERVDPETAYVQSGNDRRANLRGARLYLLPLAGQSPETITRTLECHQTRATLGQIEASVDDPYVLPGHWLDFDTHSEGDGFSVTVSADSFADAKLVLDRARRHFASSESPSR